MEILEDQGVTTLWCGLGPEFGSDLVPLQRCFSSDGPVKLIRRVCLIGVAMFLPTTDVGAIPWQVWEFVWMDVKMEFWLELVSD